MKTFCGLSHWQWAQWQYDRRQAYQRTFPPAWRAKNQEYFIKHTSDAVRAHLLKDE
jgi:hypothetical protein